MKYYYEFKKLIILFQNEGYIVKNNSYEKIIKKIAYQTNDKILINDFEYFLHHYHILETYYNEINKQMENNEIVYSYSLKDEDTYEYSFSEVIFYINDLYTFIGKNDFLEKLKNNFFHLFPKSYF